MRSTATACVRLTTPLPRVRRLVEGSVVWAYCVREAELAVRSPIC